MNPKQAFFRIIVTAALGSLFILVSTFPAQAQAQAQAQALDSLENVLNTAKLTPQEELLLLDQVGWGYVDVNVDKSVKYLDKGIRLARKLKDDRMEMKLYRLLGEARIMNSEYGEASENFKRSLELAVSLGDETQQARIYASFGNMYTSLGEYPKALDNYLIALAFFEKEDDKMVQGIILNNIAAMYQYLQNFEKALEYNERSAAICREIDDTEGLASSLISIADITLMTGGDKTKALADAIEALTISRSTGNKYLELISLMTVAKIHRYHEEYDKSSGYAKESVDLARELGYPKFLAQALINLSNDYLYQGHYSRSEELAEQAWQTDTTDMNIALNIVANFVRANIYMKNPERAMEYFDKYREMLTERATAEYQASLSEMEVRYETEKKEMKIAAMEEKQRLYVILGIVAMVLLIAVVIIFVVRHRLATSKLKLSEQQVKQLEREKQLVATQALLDGETAERTRLARDLHDGLGGMLSTIKLNLNDVKKDVTIRSDDVKRFDSALSMLNDSINELRRVAHNMMPDSLSRYGLKVSLTDLCNSIPTAEFHYFGDDGRIDPKLEVMIYRTILELVNNAIKHSGADRIVVQIVQEPERIAFTVQDNGCGFDPSIKTAGTGLENMRIRATSFGGRLSIWSEPDKGTEISAEFELYEENGNTTL